MARSKSVTYTKAEIDQATKIAEIFSASELVELINDRWRFAWINFRAGFYRGVGTTLGIATVVVLIGYLVVILGGVPGVGSFIKSIRDSVPTTSTQVK